MWGTLCPPLFDIYFYYFLIFLLLFFYFFNYIKKIKKNTAFWGLQICPSSIEFMSVTNVSNEMK